MPDLDKPQTYTSLDRHDMRGRLRHLHRQGWAGWRQALSASLPGGLTGCDRVVIGGMGGSAIAGDLIADLMALQRGVPVMVVRDFRIPFALDQRTLVIICSYSGYTEETLSLFHHAQQFKARVLVATGGGSLAQEATARRVPVLAIDVPGEPRNAVAFNLMLLLGALQRAGLARATGAEVSVAMEALRQKISTLDEDVPTQHNLAKQLALGLIDRVALLYGGGLCSSLAGRWKSQLNENAKAWAFSESIPELLHNSVEAYASHGTGRHFTALLLRPAKADAPLACRYEAVARLLQQHGIPHRTVLGDDGPPLAQMLGMLVLGDYVSYYLAMLKGVDPTPTPNIAAAKEHLAGYSLVAE